MINLIFLLLLPEPAMRPSIEEVTLHPIYKNEELESETREIELLHE